MSENLGTESDLQDGGQGKPNPTPSSANAQPSSTPADLVKQLRALETQVKAMQSDKDRGISRVAKEFDAYKPVLDKVKSALGDKFDLSGVERDLEFDAMKQKINSLMGSDPQPDREVSSGSRSNMAASDAVSTVLESLGLDFNDPEVVNVHITGVSEKDKISRLTKIAIARATKPEPTTAALASAQAEPKQVSRAELKNKYISEVTANRGNPQAIRAVREKYKKEGLDVENIGFSV